MEKLKSAKKAITNKTTTEKDESTSQKIVVPQKTKTAAAIAKDDLVALISRKNDMPKVEAKEVIKDVINGIKKAILSGDCHFDGFGSFKVVTRAPRPARNLHTGEEVIVPEHKTVVFTPSKALKEAVNK